MSLPVVFSLSGPKITDEERHFFAQTAPSGFILFKRNIESPLQLKKLIAQLKSINNENCDILIDQEGGRVQRMSAPHWNKYPCMNECKEKTSLENVIGELAKDLVDVGITMNCAPVLDVLQKDTDNSIGDRAFSDNADLVTDLGEIACQKFLDGKITPIVKHLPGHGRAKVDSHAELPYIDTAMDELRRCDFVPFQRLFAHPYLGAKVHGMVGHCLYSAIDEDYPASLSKTIIQDIIRGEIGMPSEQLLFSDDLSMGALARYGDVATRAELCLQAGCDIALYCAGHLDDMQAIARKLGA